MSIFDPKLLEQKLKEYRQIADQIKELEAKKKEVSQIILNMIPQEMKKLTTPHYKVFKQQRLSFKTTIEEATGLHAVKTEVVLDKEKLKAMIEEGQDVPGVSKSEFILVKNHLQDSS